MVYSTFHGLDKQAELLFFFNLFERYDEDDDIEDDNDVSVPVPLTAHSH